MSNFLSLNDYKAMMPEKRLNQASDSDPLILASVEAIAVQVVKDALYSKYDISTIFQAVGTARKPNVVRWVTVLCVYYLYERLPDIQVPSRITASYEEVVDVLDQISDGKRSVDLPLKEPAYTKFRYGSLPPRSH